MVCMARNCSNEVHASGLCQKHYMRVRRHGSADAGRGVDGRVKSAHPQWEAWKTMLRAARRSGGYDPRWDDFWSFLADVGERPEGGGRLYRIDARKPYQANNVAWKTPLLDAAKLENQAAYQRAFRMKRPDLARSNAMRRLYGITLAQYEDMAAAQGNVCAICGKSETKIDPRYGDPFPLAVDHDHTTGAIRGLLCMKHNRGLGLFDDNIDDLRAAVAYLESHPPK